MEGYAVLFDFDDTLGDREYYAYRAYDGLLDRIAPQLSGLEKENVLQSLMIWDEFGDVKKSRWIHELRDTFGIECSIDPEEWWNQNLWRYTKVFDDARPTLQALKAKGYKLGVVTNGVAFGQRQKVVKSGLLDLLDDVVVSGEVGVKKPDPAIFKLASERIGVPVEKCIFVGDMFQRDIIGAKRAGMEAIWIWPHGQRYIQAEIRQIHRLSELVDIL